MTVVIAAPLTDFRPHDAVRLLDRHGDVPAGTRGRIIGRFARSNDPTYVVSFEHEDTCVIEVRSDQIVPADVVRPAA